ncbi:MAG TPA: hypothetical protein VN823_27645 [Stellaceae bacterium]|nr:hypothetical protein [Stellaceae bacterium]
MPDALAQYLDLELSIGDTEIEGVDRRLAGRSAVGDARVARC